MESRKHRQIALRIARLKNSEYHGDKGVDIRTKSQAIEVEVDSNLFGAARKQLAGTTKAAYIAVPTDLVKKAIDFNKGTRFGVMGPTAKIYKRGKSSN